VGVKSLNSPDSYEVTKMELPEETQKLIAHYLEKVRQDPEHNLGTKKRLEIYKRFGNSRLHLPDFPKKVIVDYDPVKEGKELEERLQRGLDTLTIADYAYGWLAIISAENVLPIWKQSRKTVSNTELYSNDPREMLKIAKDILNKNITAKEADYQLCNRFYYGLGSDEIRTDEKVFNVIESAYKALTTVLYCPVYLEPEDDPAFHALTAFAFVVKKRSNETDNIKKLEFWEWWLTEAIPQAWQMAQVSMKEEKKL
jgi:Immunity protein Imm5